jgi:hypothetical protein
MVGMTGSHEPSHPPSDPHVRGRPVPDAFAPDDRSVRVRLIAASVFGLVLVAIGFCLWRRPHAPADASAAEEPASAATVAVEAPPPAVLHDAGVPPVAVSEARVLGCHDRGPRVTPPGQCDHVAPFEKALAAAVEQAATCVPAAAAGGIIEYVADVSFLHRKVNVTLPHAGRSVHDRKVLRACAAAVRGTMQLTPLDGVDHQHAQYKIAVTATYRAAADGG